MKNIYSILSLCLVLTSISVFGQSRVYAPNLRAPQNMEPGQMPNALLDWDAVTGVALDIMYELQLAQNIDFSDAQTFEKTDVTAMAMSKLIFGNKYYWRVRAYDDGLVSEWSEIWGFNVAWNVTMDKPDEGEVVFTNPTISWDEMTGIDGYEMQLDTSYAWTHESTGVSNDILSSAIVANDDMWVVGTDGLVLHGDGTTWATVDVGTSANLNSVSFTDANNGYIVGDAGTVIYFDGTVWTIIDPGVDEDLFGVSFINIDNGVIVGDSGVIVMYNAGTWEIVTTGDDNLLKDVVMIDASNVWACGLGKTVVNYDGANWYANVVGSKDHYGISMIDANNGWVVGKSGAIDRWNGTEWLEVVSPTNNKSLSGVSFVGEVGYIVGQAGTMLEYNGSWNFVTTGLSEDLNSVLITGDNGLVVGNGGVMMRKTNDGFNSPYLKTFDIPADTTSWDLSELIFGQTFYYKIRAFHGDDISKWSGVKSFTTQASPTLTTPSDGSDTDLSIEFKWNEYKGITNYIIEIDASPSFANPSAFSTEEDTIVFETTAFGTEFHWRVAAQHALDISDWSDVWTYTTANTVLLETPENAGVEVKRCPLYKWEPILGPVEYEVWVDTDAAFSNPVISIVDEAEYQCQSTLEYNTMYYWKVRGVSGPNNSEWSERWSFTTEQGIGIEEQVDTDAISIFPNPGNGEFTMTMESSVNSTYLIRVIDISGKLIYETGVDCSVGNNSININIENIESGSYNLIISNDNGLISKRLLIQ